jgi:hypothetical protein
MPSVTGWRRILGAACELAGLAVLSWAAYLLHPVAGLAVAGCSLVAVGLALGGGR